MARYGVPISRVTSGHDSGMYSLNAIGTHGDKSGGKGGRKRGLTGTAEPSVLLNTRSQNRAKSDHLGRSRPSVPQPIRVGNIHPAALRA
jgi:hypothetical protein